MTTLDQALSDLRAAHEEIARLKKESDGFAQTADAYGNLLSNIGDTLRSRGCATGPLDERTIALAQKHDAALARVELLEKAAKATLLFYSVGPWDEQKKTEWFNLTQTNEATTKNLCDGIRSALSASQTGE